MKIVILSSTHKSTGGVERFSAYLESTIEGIGSEAVVFGREDLGPVAQAIVNASSYAGLLQPVLGYYLGRKALESGFDICVTNGLLGWNITNRKVINVQHGTFARAADRIDRQHAPLKYFIKKHVWGSFEGLAARRASVCVAVSEETKESVERYYKAKNVQVIGNAVDTELFHPADRIAAKAKMGMPPGGKIALFVGRYEYAKGRAILEALKPRLRELGVTLVIAESYSQEQLSVLYRAADVFVFPSLHEGCSYALLEAMSSGLSFAASPVGLAADFAKKGMFSDCVVMEQSSDAYFDALKKLLALPESEKAKLTGDCRDYIVKTHSMASFNAAYAHLMQKV